MIYIHKYGCAELDGVLFIIICTDGSRSSTNKVIAFEDGDVKVESGLVKVFAQVIGGG